MLDNKNRLIQSVLWFMPTWLELVIYVFISLFTVFISNLSFVNQFLFASGDFNPIRAAIDSISLLLENVVGEQIAGSLSLAIFWGLIGLLVNVIWWVGSNFSTELNNDLVFSKYVHPKNYDPKSPLREFVSRTVFRAGVAIVLVFYANFVMRFAIPQVTSTYNQAVSEWSTGSAIGLLVAMLWQLLILHLFVILFRLLLLKKQVFGG